MADGGRLVEAESDDVNDKPCIAKEEEKREIPGYCGQKGPHGWVKDE